MHYRTAALSMLLVGCLVAVGSAKPRSTRAIFRIYADKNSDVHIVLSNGKEAVVPHQQDQSGVEDVKIADDARTAGWLVLYPAPNNRPAYKFSDIAFSIIIWRDGKIVRTFDTGPTYWS